MEAITPHPGVRAGANPDNGGDVSPLTARDRIILFCAATGTDHTAIGITARAMKAMAARGLIARDAAGVHGLTDRGRAWFRALLQRSGWRG